MQTLTPAYPEISLQVPSIVKVNDRSLWLISSGVILIHLFVIVCSASFYSQREPVYKAPEKLVVKTITLGEFKPKRASVPIAPVIESLPEEPVLEEPVAIVEEIVAVPQAEPPMPVEVQKEESPPPEPIPVPEELPAPKVEEFAPAKPISPKPVQPKPIPKKTIAKKVETPPKPKPKPAPQKKVAQKLPVKAAPPKNAPLKKTEPKKNVEVSKIDPKAEALKTKQRELLAKAQESIGKIPKNSGKISAIKNSSTAIAALPSKIQGLHIDTITSDSGGSLSATELSYRDELASRLKLLLKLPEYGQVKIRLTLERSGKVAKLEIVSAESSANRKYVEKTVPTLTLPAFGNYFSGKSEYTFAITLSNDI